jgi:hypothetical protein
MPQCKISPNILTVRLYDGYSFRLYDIDDNQGAAFMLGNILFLANKFDEMNRLFLGRYMADVISGEDRLLIVFG